MKKIVVLCFTFIVLVLIFWMMPDTKVDTIGDFFEKLIKPIGLPLSIILGARYGFQKYLDYHNKHKS